MFKNFMNSGTEGKNEESLINAAKNGDLKLLESLLHQNVHIDVNMADKDGKTALYWACFNGNLSMLHALLSKGAKTYILAKDEDTPAHAPLHAAVKEGHVAIVKLLTQDQMAINLIDSANHTLLHYACFNLRSASYSDTLKKRIDIANRLISNGANLDAVNDYGNTALHLACQNRLIPIIQLLLDKGANPLIKNEADLTPLDLIPKGANSRFTKLYLKKSIKKHLALEEKEHKKPLIGNCNTFFNENSPKVESNSNSDQFNGWDIDSFMI